MGLDIGVVNVTYLERPASPTYDFLRTLAQQSCQPGWGGGWEGNAFVEITQSDMLDRAATYGRQHRLSLGEAQALVDWIRGLPWDGESIMLHLNW